MITWVFWNSQFWLANPASSDLIIPNRVQQCPTTFSDFTLVLHVFFVHQEKSISYEVNHNIINADLKFVCSERHIIIILYIITIYFPFIAKYVYYYAYKVFWECRETDSISFEVLLGSRQTVKCLSWFAFCNSPIGGVSLVNHMLFLNMPGIKHYYLKNKLK